ncbi:MAG: radical SAM family heme chaperone HemW [Bacteroidales bacterium]|nr:MAG: radical SAM family heme chaperone HemW [Bacteroidales bacterium]
MAGIYIHIPFCRKMCHYCNFHRALVDENINVLLKSLVKEIELRKNYLGHDFVETIYFGGGTPSILEISEINLIISTIRNNFKTDDNPEITLEANPDDLGREYLQKLIENTLINRLSIGIQSFYDEDLKLLNRRHNSVQAKESVAYAQEAGFSNISIDLIYGLPGMTADRWKSNLKQAFKLNVQHISAYHLTFEPGTEFYRLLNEGVLSQLSDNESLKQFELLIELAQKNKFIHYEISNFAKDEYYSIHNTNYWKQKKYLGIGPSAHSYNYISRQWNIADNNKYIEGVNNSRPYTEKETLDATMKYNDYILTSLRTMWGTDLSYIESSFGAKYSAHIAGKSKKFLDGSNLTEDRNILKLTEKGKFISDYIISELMFP